MVEGKDPKRPTKRDYYEGMAAQGDPEAIAELEAAKEPPHHAGHVWRYFHDLHASERPSNGFSVCRIPRASIRVWERDEGVRLAAWERQAILRLDALYVKVTSEQQAEGRGD